MDCAGNNIRSISLAHEIMKAGRYDSKKRSDLKLLGFMHEGVLTANGRRAASARTNESVARLWCDWLKQTTDEELMEINPRGGLSAAKRALSQFWRLKEEVRDYFLANIRTKGSRRTLQTIELLCNASEVVQELSLSEIETLSELLRSNRVPEYIREDVKNYFDNKGTRGWDMGDDRRIVLLAWREADEDVSTASPR
jgi:hypothetical protein